MILDSFVRLRLDRGDGSSRHETWAYPVEASEFANLSDYLLRKNVMSAQVVHDGIVEILTPQQAHDRFVTGHPKIGYHLLLIAKRKQGINLNHPKYF